MPRQKDLKRLVRTRMQKTGEAYTTARAQILKKPKTKTVSRPSSNYAELAGTSDATIKEKTGCTWQRWVKALDKHGAAELSHGDVARLVNTKYKIDGWWSQMVTVGYERIKGRRAKGQRLDGSYEASKSRTFNVPVTTLFEAWAQPTIRRRWLNGEPVKIRTARAPKTMRLGWRDGTIVVVGFMEKGKSRSAVALSHTKLPDRDTVERLKQYWSERLDALGEILGDMSP
jgi:uncharacterized protein YndB with AHSA1/START domain